MSIKNAFDSIRVRYPELSGKTAIVTGSSRGIGKGIALRLGREGMKVVITSRTADLVSKTVDEFVSLGIETCGIAADLSRDEGLDALFKATASEFGPVDVMVNNAADLRRFRTENLPDGMVDYQLDVNIRAPMLCSIRSAEIMKNHGGGNIVNITSVGALRAHFRGLPYDACKGAMDSMTRSMALDLCDYGIRVNSIAPGFTFNKSVIPDAAAEWVKAGKHLDHIPLHRAGTPLDIGNAVAFLCSEDASYMIGQIIYVDGGITTMLGTPVHPL